LIRRADDALAKQPSVEGGSHGLDELKDSLKLSKNEGATGTPDAGGSASMRHSIPARALNIAKPIGAGPLR